MESRVYTYDEIYNIMLDMGFEELELMELDEDCTYIIDEENGYCVKCVETDEYLSITDNNTRYMDDRMDYAFEYDDYHLDYIYNDCCDEY